MLPSLRNTSLENNEQSDFANLVKSFAIFSLIEAPRSRTAKFTRQPRNRPSILQYKKMIRYVIGFFVS